MAHRSPGKNQPTLWVYSRVCCTWHCSSLCSCLLQRVLENGDFGRGDFSVERLPDSLMIQVSRHRASEANLSAARTHLTAHHFNSGEIETALLSPRIHSFIPRGSRFCVVEKIWPTERARHSPQRQRKRVLCLIIVLCCNTSVSRCKVTWP